MIGNTHELLAAVDRQLQAGLFDQARASCRSILENTPSDSEAQFRMALACSRLGLYEDAISYLEQCANHFNNSTVYNLLGKYLALTGRFSDAKRAYRRGLSRGKANVESIAGLANVAAQQGKFQEAAKLVMPLLRKKVLDISLANTAVALSRELGNLDTVLEYLLSYAKDCGAEADIVKSEVLFLIAGLYERKACYKQALEYYIRANEFRADTYDPFMYDQNHERCQRTYTPEYFMRCSRSSIDTDVPIFVVGMPRSGTTLIEQILSSHSAVYGAGELPDIGNFVSEFSLRNRTDYPECMELLSVDVLDGFAEAYLEHVNGISDHSKYVVDKMPHNFIYLGFISQLFPGARIIYCKRNAADTCLSIYCNSLNDSHGYATRFGNIAHQFKYSVDMMNWWKSVLPVPILEISYESLVDDLQSNLNRLFDFCNLKPEDDCLEFYKNERFVNTASKNQVTRPIYSTSVGKWKNYMPDIAPMLEELKKYDLV